MGTLAIEKAIEIVQNLDDDELGAFLLQKRERLKTIGLIRGLQKMRKRM